MRNFTDEQLITKLMKNYQVFFERENYNTTQKIELAQRLVKQFNNSVTYDICGLDDDEALAEFLDETELYQCQYCGKYITNDEGITCVGGEWVCDNDSCRTDDEEGDSHIKQH